MFHFRLSIQLIAIAWVMGLGVSVAEAGQIGSVSIDPPAPVVGDPITISTRMDFLTGGFVPSSFDVNFTNPNDLSVDIFISAPGRGEFVIQVLTSVLVDAPLGALDPGDYTYQVNMYEIPRGTLTSIFQGSQAGSFTVTPEPGSATLLAVAGAWLMTRKRRA